MPFVLDHERAVPVYVYRRQDGSVFELAQRITDNGLVSCPTTGQAVERVLQPFSAHYKGTGFYSTDSRTPKATEQPRGGDHADSRNPSSRPGASTARNTSTSSLVSDS
jgi:predicted nucleic acid-binding Zn ribbon protein